LYASFSSVIFILLGQFSSSAVHLPFLSHDSLHFVVLILSIGGPTQFINNNDEMCTEPKELLLGDTISFIELNERSHSEDEFAMHLIPVFSS